MIDDQSEAMLEEARQRCDALFRDLKAQVLTKEQREVQVAQAWEDRPQPDSCPQPSKRSQLGTLRLRTLLGRAVRHWNTPEGRLLVSVRLAEAALLPDLSAGNAEERGRVNMHIAAALRLPDAVEAGCLTGFLVIWEKTRRWPRCPVRVQLFWPDGNAQGKRIVGEHSALLAELVLEARQPPLTHWLNGRLLDGPPRQSSFDCW